MKRAAIVAALGCAVVLRAAAAPTITVYTTSFLPVAHDGVANVTVYWLDEPEKPLGALSKGLPDTVDAAAPMVLSRINTPQGQRLLGELKRAYQGVVNAWLNDVEQLPAILIDDRYLLYGVYDVNKALTIFKNHQTRQRR